MMVEIVNASIALPAMFACLFYVGPANFADFGVVYIVERKTLFPCLALFVDYRVCWVDFVTEVSEIQSSD